MTHRTKQDKPCAHTKQKHKHMTSKTKAPVLIFISLLIISCIIEYVTNKRTLNKITSHVQNGTQMSLLVSCVFTRHDKHESTQPVKNTSCVPHKQVKTRERCQKGAKNELRATKRDNGKNMQPNHVPDKTQCTRTEERSARANWRPHAPTARANLERECSNSDTKTKTEPEQDRSARIR